MYLKEKMQAEEKIIAAILVHTKPKKKLTAFCNILRCALGFSLYMANVFCRQS